MPSPRYRFGGSFRKFGTDSYAISGTFCAFALLCASLGAAASSPARSTPAVMRLFIKASTIGTERNLSRDDASSRGHKRLERGDQVSIEILPRAPCRVDQPHASRAPEICGERREQARGALGLLGVQIAHEQPLARQDRRLAGAQQQEISSVHRHGVTPSRDPRA